MAAYMVVHAVIHDPEGFVEYAKAAAAATAKYGGQYVVRGGHEAVLEGVWPHNRKTVISKWPSIEAIQAFWNSEEYTEAKALREEAATCEIAIFDGISI